MRICDWSSDVCSSDLLVARDVAHLLVIADGDQIIGVGRILVAGMDAEESLGRKDGLAIVSRRIIAERAHQLRAPRPYRIGVLALHLVEYLRRVLVPALLRPLIGEIVESLPILGDVFRVRLVSVTPHRKSGV